MTEEQRKLKTVIVLCVYSDGYFNNSKNPSVGVQGDEFKPESLPDDVPF